MSKETINYTKEDLLSQMFFGLNWSTTDLVKKSAETKATILCHSNYFADFILKEETKIGLEIPKPMTYSVLEGSYKGGRCTRCTCR